MNTRRLATGLVVFVTLVAALLGINVALGNTPILGLDLQGGLSVIYQTAEPASEEELVVVRDLMRGQLEDFGIAEPDVRVEGENIIVDLPGVSDQAAAFEALEVSGIIDLRPVIGCLATAPASTTPSTTSTTPDTTSTPPSTAPVDEPVEEESTGFLGQQRPLTATAPTETTVPAETTVPTETSVPDQVTVPAGPSDSSLPVDTLPPVVDDIVVPEAPTGQATLPYPALGQDCAVGPIGGSGEVFTQGSAEATIADGQWLVTATLRDDGQAIWNQLAASCFNASPECPSRQLAIVLDGTIQSAPEVNAPSFPDDVSITGSFTEEEARSLARTLNRGAFPVPVEQQRVETVSPTAGQDSLNAALIAGLVGVACMLAFMIFYYRKLAVIIVGGLLVWGMTVFTLSSLVSQATNYALTLAGATGIIVAVGVTVDSYVVFFERLRDEMRAGRTLANAGPRSFSATWRTIWSADLISLFASVILFALSVGSVKGFALYLGLTTICDLTVFYFFTRPAVYLLGRSKWFESTTATTTKRSTPSGATS